MSERLIRFVGLRGVVVYVRPTAVAYVLKDFNTSHVEKKACCLLHFGSGQLPLLVCGELEAIVDQINAGK